jgi:hypothetical protein
MDGDRSQSLGSQSFLSPRSHRAHARASPSLWDERIFHFRRNSRVFSPAKTVADCFKFRSKVGLDVAIEALKECRQLKKASIDELAAAAKVCRVANVMRPYLESL